MPPMMPDVTSDFHVTTYIFFGGVIKKKPPTLHSLFRLTSHQAMRDMEERQLQALEDHTAAAKKKVVELTAQLDKKDLIIHSVGVQCLPYHL